MTGRKQRLVTLAAFVGTVLVVLLVEQLGADEIPLRLTLLRAVTIVLIGALVSLAGSHRLLGALFAALGAGFLLLEDMLFRGHEEPGWLQAVVLMGSAFLVSFLPRRQPAEEYPKLLTEFGSWIDDLESQADAADHLLPDGDEYPTDLPQRIPALNGLLGGNGLFVRLERLRPALRAANKRFALELDEIRDELSKFLDCPVHGAEFEVPRRSVLMAFASAEKLEVETWLRRRYAAIVSDRECRQEFPRTLAAMVRLLGLIRDLCVEALVELQSRLEK